MSNVTIYTDGACKGNPGPGGWGALIIYSDSEDELFGGEKNTTNNRMELKAVIEALRSIKYRSNIKLYTDSMYVKKGISEWLIKWKKSGWKTSNNASVKNKDLWLILDLEQKKHLISWMWIKGHSGNIKNDYADNLANKGVESILSEDY